MSLYKHRVETSLKKGAEERNAARKTDTASAYNNRTEYGIPVGEKDTAVSPVRDLAQRYSGTSRASIITIGDMFAHLLPNVPDSAGEEAARILNGLIEDGTKKTGLSKGEFGLNEGRISEGPYAGTHGNSDYGMNGGTVSVPRGRRLMRVPKKRGKPSPPQYNYPGEITDIVGVRKDKDFLYVVAHVTPDHPFSGKIVDLPLIERRGTAFDLERKALVKNTKNYLAGELGNDMPHIDKTTYEGFLARRNPNEAVIITPAGIYHKNN